MTERTYILSTGRTGTNFLAHYFSTHPDAVARHEPGASRLLRVASNMRLAGSMDKTTAARIFRTLDALNRPTAERYIESNPFLVGLTDIVLLTHPTARIAHIVRDPRIYIPSIMNHNNTSGFKLLGNKYLPFWLWRTSSAVDEAHSDDLFARYAEYWTVANEFIARHGQPTHELFRFEDVFELPRDGLAELEAFVGLDMDRASGAVTIERPLNTSRDEALPAWTEWTDDQVVLVDRLCGTMMERHGYGRERAWRERVATARAARTTT